MNPSDTTPLFPIEVTPKALSRAKLLMQEAERRRDLFGQSLNETTEAQTPAPLDQAAADEPTGVSATVRHIADSADQKAVAVHSRLQKASRSAAERAADDPEVLRLQRAIYGAPAEPAKTSERAEKNDDVIDVVATRPAAPQLSDPDTPQ
jgi:hypothetical protein